MLSYTFVAIASFSIAIAAFIGIIRMQQVGKRYLPFLLFLIVGLANEVVSDITSRIWRTNSVNADIYMIAESILILWLFYEWKLFRQKYYYPIIGLFFIGFWIIETFILGSIWKFSTGFSAFHSLVIVLLNIQYINRLIVSEKNLTLRNPEFLICCCMILFYTVSAIVEIFWFYGFETNLYFVGKVYAIVTFINLFINLTYALATLWIPKKPAFITLS